MRSEFEVAFNEITELRELPQDVVLEALQSALVLAYRRDTGASEAQLVEADIDPRTGRPRIFVEKEVVDSVLNDATEVDLESARFFEPEAVEGDTVMVKVQRTTRNFGRIAAMTAKQVILQKIREAERNLLYEEYLEREGDLITGTVQSTNAHMITLSLGRGEAIMPRSQQIPGERYRPHDKVRTYVLEVRRSNSGPQIIVSRGHRNMLRRLLEYEVPEIYNGQVEIKTIAREAGYRSKVAVAALQDGIDPVGACVGMRGMRIQNIVRELHEEKIDVIEWVPEQRDFIAKALSPARVNGVYLDDDIDTGRTALVIVPDDQLSLAIGREGQNARLAAKLTGWRIDIKSVSESVADALERVGQPPLAEMATQQADLFEEATRIITRKNEGRMIMPEEYAAMGRFADLVESRLLVMREARRAERMEEINAARETLPEEMFQISVDAFELPDEILEALQPFETVGEVMWRCLLRDASLLRRLEAPEAALAQILSAWEAVQARDDAAALAEAEAESEAGQEAAVEGVATPTAEVSEEGDATPVATEEVDLTEAVFADDQAPAPQPDSRKPARRVFRRVRPEPEFEEELEEPEGDLDEVLNEQDEERKRRESRRKRRQLVFDEELGEVVAVRRRKKGREREEWDDFLD
ncbi:MAG: transcription termination factor NusA [Anaerolineaceae bacterium]|nr:transcription termination factor NusA [Anaerolineaceae bacterium]